MTDDVNKIIKNTIQHECGHLLYYLKYIQTKNDDEITKLYNNIYKIYISNSFGYFRVINNYYDNRYKSKIILISLGGMIIDKMYNNYQPMCYKHDFKKVKRLKLSNNDINKTIYKEMKHFKNNDLNFINDMNNKFNIKNNYICEFNIYLKDMNELICNYYPIFKNRLYKINII